MRPVAGDWIRVAILLKPVLPRIDSCFHASIQSLTALLCHRIMTFLRASYGSFNEAGSLGIDPLILMILRQDMLSNSTAIPLRISGSNARNGIIRSQRRTPNHFNRCTRLIPFLTKIFQFLLRCFRRRRCVIVLKSAATCHIEILPQWLGASRRKVALVETGFVPESEMFCLPQGSIVATGKLRRCFFRLRPRSVPSRQ